MTKKFSPLSDKVWNLVKRPYIFGPILLVIVPLWLVKSSQTRDLGRGLALLLVALVSFISGWLLVGVNLRIGGSVRSGVFWAVVLYLLIGIVAVVYSPGGPIKVEDLFPNIFWPLILLFLNL